MCRCAGRILGAAKAATHKPAAQHAKLPAPAAPGMAATVQHPTAAFGSGPQEQQHPHRLGAWVLQASMQRALTAATCLPGGLLATVPQHAAQGALRPCAHLRLQQQRLLELAARQASTTHLPRRMLLLQQGLQQQRQQLEAVEDLGAAVWQAVLTWDKEAAVPRQCRRRCSACCCATASPASSQLGSCWSARCCSPARRCGPCPLGCSLRWVTAAGAPYLWPGCFPQQQQYGPHLHDAQAQNGETTTTWQCHRIPQLPAEHAARRLLHRRANTAFWGCL